MARIVLHIGLPGVAFERLQTALAALRPALARQGVLFPEAGGGGASHQRLYMAASDPEAVDALRAARGLASPGAQARARRKLVEAVAEEAALIGAETILFSAAELATLHSQSALERLRDMLLPLGEDFAIVAHVDGPARMLLRHYEQAIMVGRTAPLSQELELAARIGKAREGGSWHELALAHWQRFAPERHDLPDIQAPPFWLDLAALQRRWEQAFGEGALSFRPGHDGLLATGSADEIAAEISQGFGFGPLSLEALPEAPPRPSGLTLARARARNEALVGLLEEGHEIKRRAWRRLLGELEAEGAPTRAGALAPVARALSPAMRGLAARHPALGAGSLRADRALGPWAEPDPGPGFDPGTQRAELAQRLGGGKGRPRRDEDEPKPAAAKPRPAPRPQTPELSAQAARILSPDAQAQMHKLAGSRFAPHNDLGRDDEGTSAPPYPERAHPAPPEGSSGKVVVACMKNEAPYILEWIAYHRAIGVDRFLIYTNDCTDGTDRLLGRLDAMGIVEHRNNDAWKGKSPQQHALNMSLEEPVIRQADWVIHIDVDEFINVRVGDGLLDDFLALVPEATNVAMTWRLFGHNGVHRLEDRPVIAQFDHAAPRYCPKPHTVWGFKTMVRNTGAYGKLSCHRPNKLAPEAEDKVLWVNGNGAPMDPRYKTQGWRSDVKSVGYDLIQLNHYALRSAESYLVKRQRGRALHVDRSIGLNYWIRMDWSDYKDVSIQRNLPRLEAELARLKADAELARLHDEGFAWHQAKAAELHRNPEFEALFTQALELRLSPLERVAHALTLDLES